MIRTASAAAALALLASGCGHGARTVSRPTAESGVPGAPTTAVRHDHGVVVKVYEVGKDLAPGVYTTRSRDCSAIATATADYDPAADDADPEGMLAESVTVGEVERIALQRGEFFQVEDCAIWRRETGSGPRSPDPATVAGACTILLHDRLLEEVATFLREPTTPPVGAGSRLQDRLMAVVASNLASRGALRTLANASGRLVDLIDDPNAYPDLDARMSTAVARVRAVCGR